MANETSCILVYKISLNVDIISRAYILKIVNRHFYAFYFLPVHYFLVNQAFRMTNTFTRINAIFVSVYIDSTGGTQRFRHQFMYIWQSLPQIVWNTPQLAASASNTKGMLQHLYWYQSTLSALTISIFHTIVEYRNVKIRMVCLV